MRNKLFMVPVIALVVAIWLFRIQTRPLQASRQSGPLTLVPAGLPRPLAVATGFLLAFSSAAIIAIGILFVNIVTSVVVTDDALLPEIKSGDRLLLIRSGSFVFDINRGDTISFQRGETVVCRRVLRTEGQRVFVHEGDRVVPVDLQAVIGKMIRVIPEDDSQP